VLDPLLAEQASERTAVRVAPSVVGHQPLGLDSVPSEEGERTLGEGSIAGSEYLHDMEQARVNGDGVAHWVEVCFCEQPLEEERPYWEKYFDLLTVKDAHARRNCRHENGTEAWACCDCDCTRRLKQKLQKTGSPFLTQLQKTARA
jgi:hypothetical protein